jgi:TctA family transporter
MSAGDYSIFIQRPIAAFFLVIALIMLLLGLKPLFIKKRDWRERLTEAQKDA